MESLTNNNRASGTAIAGDASDQELVPVNVRITRSLRRQVRQIAAVKECAMSVVIVEAVQEYVAKRVA